MVCACVCVCVTVQAMIQISDIFSDGCFPQGNLTFFCLLKEVKGFFLILRLRLGLALGVALN